MFMGQKTALLSYKQSPKFEFPYFTTKGVSENLICFFNAIRRHFDGKASNIFPHIRNRYYFVFSKGRLTKWVSDRASEKGNVELITVDNLFAVT